MHEYVDDLATILAKDSLNEGELEIRKSLLEARPHLLSILQYLAGNKLSTSRAILEFSGSQMGDVNLGSVAGRDNIVFSVNIYQEHNQSNKHLMISVNWANIANIFWLGHDLRQAIDELNLRGFNPVVIHILNQALHHAREIGLDSQDYALRIPEKIDNNNRDMMTLSQGADYDNIGGAVITVKLESIIERLKKYTPKRRFLSLNNNSKDQEINNIKQDLLDIVKHIGKLCAGRQPDFRALPDKVNY
jgi:hypothetical protein